MLWTEKIVLIWSTSQNVTNYIWNFWDPAMHGPSFSKASHTVCLLDVFQWFQWSSMLMILKASHWHASRFWPHRHFSRLWSHRHSSRLHSTGWSGEQSRRARSTGGGACVQSTFSMSQTCMQLSLPLPQSSPCPRTRECPNKSDYF